MRTARSIPDSPGSSVMRRQAGFTLPEALISATLFILLLGGVVSANLFGMRMFQLAETKLKANNGARKALGTLTDEIRRCKSVWVGDVTNGTFVGLLDGQPQIGSALLIQPTINTSNFVVYYLTPADQTLRRLSTTKSNPTVIAQTITNLAIFCAQDCFGNVLTNSQSDRVIHATLDFVQPQPWLPAGDFSQLETSVTRRIND